MIQFNHFVCSHKKQILGLSLLYKCVIKLMEFVSPCSTRALLLIFPWETCETSGHALGFVHALRPCPSPTSSEQGSLPAKPALLACTAITFSLNQDRQLMSSRIGPPFFSSAANRRASVFTVFGKWTTLFLYCLLEPPICVYTQQKRTTATAFVP